jgi:glycosyltransferase involved in cell wall biosynthesis
MQIIIDGQMYQKQTSGGITRIFDNLIPCLCDLDPDLRVQILFFGNLLRALPKHKQISYINLNNILGMVHVYFRPWRFWHRYHSMLYRAFLKLMLGSTRNKIWFSTYYTMPPVAWKGKSIVLVPDLIYELFSDFFPESQTVIQKKKEAVENADAVLCISKTTALDLQKYYAVPATNIHVIYLSQESCFNVRAKNNINYKVDAPFLLYVGKRNNYKGFSTLLEAYAARSLNKEIKLLIVGPPWNQDEIKQLHDKGLEDKVVLLVDLDDDRLCDLYNQASAFIYPSLYEGFGIPLLEAMACSCPIVASRIPSTVEIAGDVPIYFEAGSPTDLSNALNQALSEGRTSSRVIKGLSLADGYSWDKYARETLNVINSIIPARNVDC